MSRLQKRNRSIFFRDTLVAENDRIRRELWTRAPFVRIPLVYPVIKDDERATIFDEFKQAAIDWNQILMCFVTSIVDDDRVKTLTDRPSRFRPRLIASRRRQVLRVRVPASRHNSANSLPSARLLPAASA